MHECIIFEKINKNQPLKAQKKNWFCKIINRMNESGFIHLFQGK